MKFLSGQESLACLLKRMNSRHSFFRMLVYEELERSPLSGKTLDIGGGDAVGYRDLLPRQVEYESMNISHALLPTIVGSVENGIPRPDGYYESVMSLSTLEHIFDERSALLEAYRVLAPGGHMCIAVPFLYRVHGAPDDFHRHTIYWWRRTLEEMGFDAQQTRISALSLGPITSGYSIFEFNPLRVVLRRLALLGDFILIQLLRMHPKYRDRVAGRIGDFALGYFISARKA